MCSESLRYQQPLSVCRFNETTMCRNHGVKLQYGVSLKPEGGVPAWLELEDDDLALRDPLHSPWAAVVAG